MTRVGSGVTRLALLLALVVGFGGIGAAPAASAGWTIEISGDVEGTAKNVKAQCLASADGSGPIAGRATFRVAGRRLKLAFYLAAPAEPGSRTFSPSAGPTTVVVSLSDVANPSAMWTSAGAGTGTINNDGRSGTLTGSLTGASGDVDLDAGFRCRMIRNGGARGSGGDDRAGERGDVAPGFEGTIEASTHGHCTGTETGTITVFGFSKRAVFAGIFAAGSYTCEGITVPTNGALIMSGTFRNDTLRFGPDLLLGLLLSPPGCLVGEPLVIHVRDGEGTAAPAYTAPSGDVYECTIKVEEA